MAKQPTKKPAARKAATNTKARAAKPKAAAKNTAAAKRKPAGRKAAAIKPEKVWLKSYPEGMPAEIDLTGKTSIGALLSEACARYASRPAYSCMGKTLTFADISAAADNMAAYLQSLGLEKGSRVALMMPNILQYPICLMAVLKAGYTVVNVNPLYTPRELEHQLKDSGAQTIIILENFAATLQAVAGKTPVKNVVVATMGDLLGGLKGAIVNLVVRRVKKMVPEWNIPGHVSFKTALAAGAQKTFKSVECVPGDIAFLQYTGGTTGVSKGATLSHGNILANVAQNELWLNVAGGDKDQSEQMVFICALPLYHVFALTINALMGMQLGAHNVLIPNPRDIPSFVKELQKYRFNVLPGLNTLFNALMNNEDFRNLDFSGLTLTIGGGMAVQKPVAERWKELTGCVITEGYGLSETSPVATANRTDATEFSGTIGLPVPSTEIAICDEDGKMVKTGEVGEICIRGPQVMVGYWNRPDETANVMTPDGFFKSGDMGLMDESGYTRIVDRKKDMILVSGFNVYPNEIEDVVASHPGVLECAAIGVPDEKSGEVPKIFVARKDPDLTADDLIKFCRENLTAYKCPRHVEFRDELPKTNVGKILRRELRDS